MAKLDNEHFHIAYSGGVDSQVLLNLSAKYLKGKVTALHVNHGISKNAEKWENFCKDTAESLGITFKAAHFELANEKSNLEEIARKCRYGFFEENVMENEVLITGHHLDDQAETFMLRLMRGAGIDGLSAMDSVRSFDKGFLMRPLLGVSKEEIIEYANLEGLSWVEDESNKSSDYDRNFIRNEVMPLLKTRWKKANKSIASSVSHCQVVKKEMSNEDEELFLSVQNNNKLSIEKLKELKKEKQKRVLRFWLKRNKALMPDQKNLNVILSEVAFSNEDNFGCYSTNHYELRKSYGQLFFINLKDRFLPKNNFERLKGTTLEIAHPKMRMFYKGTERTVKYILKAEKVPYWLRSKFLLSVDEKGVYVALGNILKS